MRTEREMLDLILDTARQDDRIRAVILSGSRANPDSRGDIFRDFDVVYFVADVAPFRADRTWIDRFGERMVMQMPEDMKDPPAQGDGSFIYLMQFMDGNRMDLALVPLEQARSGAHDSLSVVLLDKDNCIPPLPPPSERDYLPRPPTMRQFSDCCNEFWWCAPYVAKGLWREQITYAKAMMEQALRPQLTKMLAWYVGAQSGFTRNPGYQGKHLQQCLEPAMWDELMHTYSGPSYSDTWESLFAMCRLFRQVALPVSRQCGLEYPHDDDQRVSAHLMNVQLLPKDATEIY